MNDIIDLVSFLNTFLLTQTSINFTEGNVFHNCSEDKLLTECAMGLQWKAVVHHGEM
jgi:hypothetical protein